MSDFDDSNVIKPTPGRVKCLGGCDKLFDSIDRFTNRVCPKCAKKLAKERFPKRYSSHFGDDTGSGEGDG